LIVAGLLAWVLIPLGGFTYMSLKESTASVAPSPQIWTSVTVNDQPLRTDAQLAIARSDAYEVVAPSWTGLVQEVPLQVGGVIRHGQVVAVVDGVSRLAMATGRPFSRPLVEKDEGGDVAKLNELLIERGLDAGDGDVFTRWTLAGVRGLAESIGVADADDITAFEPAWFVFLEAEVTISEVSLRVGAPAPTAGVALVTGEPQIISARLQKRSDAVQKEQSASGDSGAEAGTSEILMPEDDEGEEAPSGQGFAALDGEVLYVGSQALELDTSKQFVSPLALATLEALTESGSSVVRASLETQPAEGTWLVPSAAIFAGESGSLCVLSRSANPGKPEAMVITVVSTVKGLTVVEGPLTEDRQVLISPEKNERQCD
jgi:hypothetical protein